MYCQAGFDCSIRDEAHGVYAKFNKESCKLREVRRPLPTDADSLRQAHLLELALLKG